MGKTDQSSVGEEDESDDGGRESRDSDMEVQSVSASGSQAPQAIKRQRTDSGDRMGDASRLVDEGAEPSQLEDDPSAINLRAHKKDDNPFFDDVQPSSSTNLPNPPASPKIKTKIHTEDDNPFLDDMQPSSSTNLPNRPASPMTKIKKGFYGHSEKKAILDFIIEKKRFRDVKGRAMWQEMETEKVCKGRSWQSMKEHYSKKLIHELSRFNVEGIVVRRLLYPFIPSTNPRNSTDSTEEEDKVSPISPTRVSPKKISNEEVSRGKDKSEAAVIDKDAQLKSGESSEDEVNQDEENNTSLKTGNEDEDEPHKNNNKHHGGSHTGDGSETQPREKCRDSSSSSASSQTTGISSSGVQYSRKHMIFIPMKVVNEMSQASDGDDKNEKDEVICPSTLKTTVTAENLKDMQDLLDDIPVYDDPKESSTSLQDDGNSVAAREPRSPIEHDSESDESDSLSLILFDVGENVDLKLHSSSVDNSTTLFAASQLREDDLPPGSGRCQGTVEDEGLDVDNSPTIEQRKTNDTGSDSADDKHVEHERTVLGNGKARVKKVRNTAQAGYSRWNRIQRMSSDSSSSCTMKEDTRHRIIRRNGGGTTSVKKKVVARRKRRESPEESGSSSMEEHEIRSFKPQGIMKPSKHSFPPHSDSVSESKKTDKEEKQSQQDTSRSCKRSERDCDPASNIDNFTGKYDYTFHPKVGLKCGLAKKVPQHRNKYRPMPKDSYTVQEDMDILKFIESEQVYHRVGGREIWQEMERSQSISHPGTSRTWQSLKERFRKRIIHRLHTYLQFGLSEKSLQCFVRRINIKPEEPMPRAAQNSTYRQRYSFAEDNIIVKFIVRIERYSEVNGKAMWVLMADTEGGLPGRTWQSLKERFLKNIINNIDKFGLSKEEVDLFKKQPGADRRWKKQKELISSVDSSDEDDESPGLTNGEELEEMDKREAIKKIKKCKMTQEDQNQQPSTSDYYLLQKEYITKRERLICKKHRPITNRDSSSILPQKKKLFTHDNSMVDLSPCTPFTKDMNEVSNIRNNLMKQNKMNVINPIEEDHNKKKLCTMNIRVLLDRSWSAKRKMDGKEKQKFPVNKEDDATTASDNEDKTEDEEALQGRGKPEGSGTIEKGRSKDAHGKRKGLKKTVGDTKRLGDDEEDTSHSSTYKNLPEKISPTNPVSKSPTKRKLEGVSNANSQEKKLPMKSPKESKISHLPTDIAAKINSSKLVPQIKLNKLNGNKYRYLRCGSKGSMSDSTSMDVEHTPGSTEKYTGKSDSEINKKKISIDSSKISHPIPIENFVKPPTKFQHYMSLPRRKLRKRPIQEDD